MGKGLPSEDACFQNYLVFFFLHSVSRDQTPHQSPRAGNDAGNNKAAFKYGRAKGETSEDCP